MKKKAAKKTIARSKTKKFRYKSANNKIGLIITGQNGEPTYFRIYGKNGSYKDYDIFHHDLRVQILDSSAELEEDLTGENHTVTYSRKFINSFGKAAKKKLKK